MRHRRPTRGLEPCLGETKNSLDETPEQAQPSRTKPTSVFPTGAEMKEHERTLPPLRAWREACVRGRTPEDPRCRKSRENENAIALANHYYLVTETDEKSTALLTPRQKQLESNALEDQKHRKDRTTPELSLKGGDPSCPAESLRRRLPVRRVLPEVLLALCLDMRQVQLNELRAVRQRPRREMPWAL